MNCGGVQGVQEFRSSGVQEFRSSGVQESHGNNFTTTFPFAMTNGNMVEVTGTTYLLQRAKTF
jgi:hypothetical protein